MQEDVHANTVANLAQSHTWVAQCHARLWHVRHTAVAGASTAFAAASRKEDDTGYPQSRHGGTQRDDHLGHRAPCGQCASAVRRTRTVGTGAVPATPRLAQNGPIGAPA